MQNYYRTGYWGIPGTSRISNVHISWDGKAICGAKFHPDSKFQFCANGVRLEYVTCNRCKERLDGHRNRQRTLDVRKFLNKWDKENVT